MISPPDWLLALVAGASVILALENFERGRLPRAFMNATVAVILLIGVIT